MPTKKPFSIGPWPKGVDNIHPPKHDFFQPPTNVRPSSYLTEAVNVDLDDQGWPTSCCGESALIEELEGASAFEYHAGYFFTVLNGTLYRLKSGQAPIPISSVTEDITFYKHAGQLFWSDGVITGRANSEGNATNWGCELPPSIVLEELDTGTMQGGTYLVTTTLVDYSGIEHGAPRASAVIISDNKAIQASFEYSLSSTAVYVNVYMSLADGSDLFYAGSYLPNQFPITINDLPSTRDPLRTMGMSPPIPTTVIGSFRGYLVLGVENAIFPSFGPNAHLYDIANMGIYFPSEVIGIAGLQEGLWVITKEAAYWVTGGDAPEEWTISDSALKGFAKGCAVITGNYVTSLDLPKQQVAAFLSEFGPAFGTDDGTIITPVRETYKIDVNNLSVKIVPRTLFRSNSSVNQLLYMVK